MVAGVDAGAGFTAAETAAETEGEFKHTAAIAALRAEAKVAVHPVDLSSLSRRGLRWLFLASCSGRPARRSSR